MAPIPVMINGLPGNVAQVLARHALADARFAVVPFSLTGPEIQAKQVEIDGFTAALVRPEDRDGRMPGILEAYGRPIAVDFTHPSAVNDNAAFYCRHNLPFVMGTTGGDRAALHAEVQASSIAAVIAPNMAKQIVGFQAMLEYAAATFPGLFAGYRLQVRESHQRGKADTSGTAKAVVQAFQRLGVDFNTQQIEMVRDPGIQREGWGVPEQYLSGHGWHTYTLDSADGTVHFEFTHNVNGRDVYAKGTLDAVAYLACKVAEGAGGRVFTMIDVLKGL
ncbi:MAG TPA: dihydrodipicolinate reductase [Desulfobacteraceae bacterium]|nr:dihydrodipicolinate reductase [Deltaproteobacteria bacterium]HDI58825.1 dihydrodipicolinate reductase [Desulfobacteraceae bacterium]